ncbi:hypothetical protein I5E68_00520 [Novosphingobium sp. YJ-S2-02]|uniref:Integrase n=1 Tax=Novosphingobium aureum TaxID=2792964 RepID=A0A931H8R5_9SPHN|nr:DUF5906 domain-containing protein [Novosphingobium aureum]MBH0111432.1 hypothetical protein [Novosphingobium aureum]
MNDLTVSPTGDEERSVEPNLPEAKLEDALDHLEWFRPEGPWTLTAIPPDGGPTKTETFGPKTATECLDWLHEQSADKMNLYFMVNPARTKLRSKAKKEDVEDLAWLHVDVDPKKLADLPDEKKVRHIEAQRARILPLLREFKPEPTLIIDSGGGFQALWRLDDPLYIGGNIPAAEEAEAYNQQLEILLGGDSCHNCDRILRLPGTINWPNEKKRKAGRVPALASVVQRHDDEEHIYGLGIFTPAPRVQSDDGGLVAPTVKISGNLPRLKDLDELPEAVTAGTKMLIVQGDDPDDQLRYDSRSEVTFAVCCELVRAGCDDDTIAAVLLDPDFGISAHTLNQKRSTAYAARQIQRAREEVSEPMLRKLNERHAVISDIGGKCRVVGEVLDRNLARPRTRISKQSFEDFRNRYMNIKVQSGETKDGNPTYTPAGKWWLEHPMRRQYETIVFAPGREVPEAYNLWQGFACEALPGDEHEPFLEHLRDNVCQGDNDHFQYLIRWMARAVQNPGEQGHVAVVLRGGRGTGKGSVAQIFGSLWGRHFLHISSAKHLVGQFNAHLRDCVALFADEAFYAGDKQHESTLKTLVTEDTLIVEGKGIDAEVAPNYVHLIMASNDDWVVPAGADERRYFILDVGEGKKQDKAYFRALHQAMDEGGREALLHYLMTMDLSDYEVREIPQTDALRDQKEQSLKPQEEWWLDVLRSGVMPGTVEPWKVKIDGSDEEAEELDRFRRSNGTFERPGLFDLMRLAAPTMRVSDASLGRFLRKQGFQSGFIQPGATTNRGWIFPPDLADARSEWMKRYGGGDWGFDGRSEWVKPDE